MEKIDYSSMTKAEFLERQKKRDDIFKKISGNISLKPYDDKYIQERIGELFDWMNESYGCSIDMFRGLAETYATNESVSSTLAHNYGEKMPEYLSRAMLYFSENN